MNSALFALLGLLNLILLADSAAWGTGYARRDIVCSPQVTVTVTSTVHDNTDTVTIALENSSQIASSVFSRASSDESLASISRELTPINPTATATTEPSTTADQFTYTEIVPVVEATKSNSGSVFYYVSKSGTSSWLDGQSPSPAVVGTTTVTVSPSPYVAPPRLLNTTAYTNKTVNSKRQVGATVTWITNGVTMTWLNNWDGSTTVDLSSWFSVHPTTTSTSTSTSTSVNTTLTMLTSTTTISSTPTITSTITVSVTSDSTSSTISTSEASATPTPADCGTVGDWILGFDDLPIFSPPDNDTAPFPPIFNPHDLLYFSDCWSYVPPPTDPFPPQNGSHLAECRITATDNGPGNNSPPDGSFGAGPRAGINAYWLNVHSAFVGCNNSDANVNCDFSIHGYHWDNTTSMEAEFTSTTIPIKGCQDLEGCQLQYVDFGNSFTGVSSVDFQASVKGTPVNWFIDTIALGWWNDTCAAGTLRATSRF